MTQVRVEKVEDFYKTMVKWWKQHDWKPLSINALPEKVFIIKRDNIDLYCCTLYETDSAFGIIAFQISNKEATNRKEGDLKMLFFAIEDYARDRGIEILFTTSSSPNVENELIDSGYILGDTNVNQYTRWVKQ